MALTLWTEAEDPGGAKEAKHMSYQWLYYQEYYYWLGGILLLNHLGGSIALPQVALHITVELVIGGQPMVDKLVNHGHFMMDTTFNLLAYLMFS